MKAVYKKLAMLACLTVTFAGSVAAQSFTTPVLSSQRYFVQFTDETTVSTELIPPPSLPTAIMAAPVQNASQHSPRSATPPVVPLAKPTAVAAVPAGSPAQPTSGHAIVPSAAAPAKLPPGAAPASIPVATTPASPTPVAESAQASKRPVQPAPDQPEPGKPVSVIPIPGNPAPAKKQAIAGNRAATIAGPNPTLGASSESRGVRPAFFQGLLERPNVGTARSIEKHPVGNSVSEIEALAGGCDSCVECPCGVWQHRTSVSASATYLRMRNADVAYGVPVDGPISSVLSNPIQVGPVGVVDPDYEVGFDVGANLALNPLTSIGMNYLSLESTTNNRIGTEAPNVIRSLVAHPSSTSAAADFLNASADLYLQMNVLDVTLRHLFVGGEVFAVNYFGGARYARMEQQFDSVFVNNGIEQVRTDIDFDGAGLTLGLEAERHSCTSCLRVYGRGAASFLAGKFQANYHQGQTFDPTVVDTSWEAGRVIPVLDLELGAGWKSKCGRVKVSAGYRVSAWFNTVKTEDFIGAVQVNDFNDLYHTLTLDGVVGRVEIGF